MEENLSENNKTEPEQTEEEINAEMKRKRTLYNEKAIIENGPIATEKIRKNRLEHYESRIEEKKQKN